MEKVPPPGHELLAELHLVLQVLLPTTVGQLHLASISMYHFTCVPNCNILLNLL